MIWLLGAVLVIISGLLFRTRLRSLRERELLSDDLIRQIEEQGYVKVEPPEPLDHEQIRMEEDRFWEEAAWDEPDEL